MAHTHAAEEHVMAVVTSHNNRSAGSDVAMRSINRGTVFSVGFTLRLHHSTDQVQLVEWSEWVGE